MLTRIITHEWRTLRADATVFVVAALFLGSIAYGLYNGVRWTVFQQRAIAAAQTEEAERFAEIGERARVLQAKGEPVAGFGDPRHAETAGRTMAGRYAIMPPAPLAALSIGQSDLLPYYFRVSTQSKEQIVGASEIENPVRLLAGRFDLSFVVIYIYPLLILALTYNLVSAEKEQGTLALALAQPVSLAALVTGKLAVRGALFLLLVVGFSIAGLLATGVDLAAPAVAARVGLWIAAIAAYGAFWFALALVVAGFGRGSATNAVALAGLWLLFVLVLPAALNIFVTMRDPVPSRVAMIQAVREASDAATREGSQLLGKYYEDHPEMAAGGAEGAMQDFNLLRVVVEGDVERRVRPVMDRYEAQLARQQASVARWRFLSPAILMQEALNDIAGTGTARHAYFVAMVEDFHRRWREFFLPRVFARTPFLAFTSVPHFAFEEEPFEAMRGRVLVPVAAVLGSAALLAIWGLRVLRRYPVTG